MPFPRYDAPELLDLNVGSLDDAAASLADLRRINRWLGGTSVVLRHLTPRLARLAPRVARPLVVADMGTGSADIPIALAQWARQSGVALHVLAIDLNQRHLALARPRLADYPEIALIAAPAGNLPLTQHVDYVVASLFLHHFPPQEVIHLLRGWYALAQCGVIVNDLIRARLPYLGYFFLQPFIARSYLTRYDAPLSIRRAYTRPEMAHLAAQAGLAAQVYWHWPWRMAVVADKDMGSHGQP